MRDLPDWFGIESSIVSYANAARTLPTTAALRNDEFVGGCVVRHHNPVAAEIDRSVSSRSRNAPTSGDRGIHA